MKIIFNRQQVSCMSNTNPLISFHINPYTLRRHISPELNNLAVKINSVISNSPKLYLL